MSPTPRLAGLLAAVAVSALLLPAPVVVLAALALLGGALADLRAVRRAAEVERSAPPMLSRGVPGSLAAEPGPGAPERLRLRQPAPPELTIDPSEDEHRLKASIVGN